MTATPQIAIIGPGRLGTGLARALDARHWSVVVLGRAGADEWRGQLQGRSLVLLTVPDDAIGEVAANLATRQAIGADQVVLHTSGVLDRAVLAPLAGTGAGLGSFAPVQTVAEPATAAERLRGAPVILEGDVRALRAGGEIAEALGMRAVELPGWSKAAYHAGAVMVANLGTALVALAERVAREGGVPAEEAEGLYLPLWRGAIANVELLGAAEALTGPVRRGDVQTVRRHLALLTGNEREAYVALSKEALRLARAAGLGSRLADRVEQALTE